MSQEPFFMQMLARMYEGLCRCTELLHTGASEAALAWMRRKPRFLFVIACMLGIWMMSYSSPITEDHSRVPDSFERISSPMLDLSVEREKPISLHPNGVPVIHLDAAIPASPQSPAIVDQIRDAIGNVFRWIVTGIVNVLTAIWDFLSPMGFITRTNSNLSYDQTTVKDLHGWMLGVLDAFVILYLIVLAYSVLLGRTTDFKETVVRFLCILLLAHFSRFFIGQIIDVYNAFCDGFLHHVMKGNTLLKPGGYDKNAWEQIVVFIILLVMYILVALQMLVRLTLLNILIILSPWALLCLAIPQTRKWGSFWIDLFWATLLVQFFQLVAIGFGASLGGVFLSGEGADKVENLAVLFMSIASCWLALHIPSMLSYPMAASVGEVPSTLRGLNRGGANRRQKASRAYEEA